MKIAILFLISAAAALGQATATIQFNTVGQGLEPVPTVLTIGTESFNTLIGGVESQVSPTCSTPVTLTQAITSASTSYTLSNASCVVPGNGLCIGPVGACTQLAGVLVAGCTGNVCQVSQGQLGTTKGNYPIGTVVTVLTSGWGGMQACIAAANVFQQLNQRGAANVTPPSAPAFAGTIVAGNNATIATAATNSASAITTSIKCAPGI